MKFDELPYEEQENVLRYLLGPVLTNFSYGALFGEYNMGSRNSTKSRCRRQGRFTSVVGVAVRKLLMAVDPVSIKDGGCVALDFEKILDAAVNYLSDGDVLLCDGISKAVETIISLSKQDKHDGDLSFKAISVLWSGIRDSIAAKDMIGVEDMELISRKINEVICSCKCLSPGEINSVRSALLSRMGEVWRSSLKSEAGARKALEIYAQIIGERISRKSIDVFIRAIVSRNARKKLTPHKHSRERTR